MCTMRNGFALNCNDDMTIPRGMIAFETSILHIDSVAPGLSILLSPCLTAPPVQYPVLDLYRSAMGIFIIILVSYFCQLLEYFKTYNLKA